MGESVSSAHAVISQNVTEPPNNNGSQDMQDDRYVETKEDNGALTANGDMKPISSEMVVKTPPPERKAKFSILGRIFKPWKWKRRKKPSEKIEKQAIDLERQISLRTTREELIKRGVLKEVDTGHGLSTDTIPEAAEELEGDSSQTEAVKESKADSEEIVANGKSNTSAPSGDEQYSMPNSIVGVGDTGNGLVPSSLGGGQQQQGGSMLRPISVNHSHHGMGGSSHPDLPSPRVMFGGMPGMTGEGELQRPESMMVEPKQIRVMLPFDEKDCNVPVIKRAIQSPGAHDMTARVSTPPASHQNSPPLYGGSLLRFQQHQQHQQQLPQHFTPSGLTYSTPGPQPTHPMSSSYSTPQTTSTGGAGYQEIPVYEPDLNQRPVRSALKGAKNREMLQIQLEQKLREKQMASQSPESGSSHVQRVGFLTPNARPDLHGPRIRISTGESPTVYRGSNKENIPVDDGPDYDNLDSDSDDEEAHYRQADSIIAAKVHRQDSLARFLNQRPPRRDLIARGLIPEKSEKDRMAERAHISKRLTRRLSLRPTAEELQQKNILHAQTQEERNAQKEEMKRTLVRKLSFRPTVEELREKKVIMFNDYVEVTDAHEYDRRADKPWTRLTPRDKAAIRKELNDFKSSEMSVHESSRHFTRFHRP